MSLPSLSDVIKVGKCIEKLITEPEKKAKKPVQKPEEESEEESDDEDDQEDEEEDAQGTDYYVVIDIKGPKGRRRTKVEEPINEFMRDQGAFDPRGVRRSRSYFSFWRVSRSFSLDAFEAMVRDLSGECKVRIVAIVNNDHIVRLCYD